MFVKVQGGIGNHLFQWAFGISRAAEKGEEIFFDISICNWAPTRLHEITSDLHFGDAGPDAPLVAERKGNYCTYTPKDYENTPPDAVYVGFWQTEKYFNIDLVREKLKLQIEPNEYVLKFAEEIQSAGSRSAFMHVRRQDFLRINPRLALATDYYTDAITTLRERYSDLKISIFAFSDDIPYLHREFPDLRIVELHWSQTVEELWLMSQCRHAIISNSSFSWWGAWWGDTQPDRTVIAPKFWIFDHPCDDIKPDRWLQQGGFNRTTT